MQLVTHYVRDIHSSIFDRDAEEKTALSLSDCSEHRRAYDSSLFTEISNNTILDINTSSLPVFHVT